MICDGRGGPPENGRLRESDRRPDLLTWSAGSGQNPFMRVVPLIILLLFSPAVFGVVKIAGGYNSVSTGHKTPQLSLGFGGADWLVTGSSSGVRTTTYYHSNYVFGLYSTWTAGDFGWGKMEFGAGGGALYGVRGFKDAGASEETGTDFVIGPALRAQWNFAGPVFLSVEGLFGLGAQALYLNVQDSVTLAVGVSTW